MNTWGLLWFNSVFYMVLYGLVSQSIHWVGWIRIGVDQQDWENLGKRQRKYGNKHWTTKHIQSCISIHIHTYIYIYIYIHMMIYVYWSDELRRLLHWSLFSIMQDGDGKKDTFSWNTSSTLVYLAETWKSVEDSISLYSWSQEGNWIISIQKPTHRIKQ